MAESKKPEFTAEEKAAMKARAKELKSQASAAEAAAGVTDAIAEMSDTERPIAERLHAVILEAAPQLAPRLWYGSPAYALDGKVLCFFQSADKFKTRYITLGFSDEAKLDEGNMWPTSFAVTALTASDEKALSAIVKKAVG